MFSMPYVRYELPNPPALMRASKEDEGFTGQVNGKKASDLEERFARGLHRDPRVDYFVFRLVKGGLPGTFGSAELDFYIKAGSWYPVQIDSDWIHKSAAARAQDRAQDDKLWQALRHDSPQPISRIKGSLIPDPETTDRVIDQLLMGRVFTADTIA